MRRLSLREVLDGAERAANRVSTWPTWKQELSGIETKDSTVLERCVGCMNARAKFDSALQLLTLRATHLVDRANEIEDLDCPTFRALAQMTADAKRDFVAAAVDLKLVGARDDVRLAISEMDKWLWK